jgi:Flp pilus assembly pilin Flp
MAEYAILAAAITVGCAPAMLFLSGAIGALFGSTARPVRTAPFQPPSPSPELTYPTTLAECEDGGWRDFPQFASEAECIDFVDGLTP